MIEVPWGVYMIVCLFAGIGLGTILVLLWSKFTDWGFFDSGKRKFPQKKFEDYMKRAGMAESKFPAPGPSTAQRETSELTYRDIDNKLRTVKVTMDTGMHDPADIKDKIMLIKDLGEKVATGEVEEFIFTAEAIAIMKMNGIDPDDVIRNMLKASGRIA